MTADNNTQDIARILSEALPFMQLYDGETVVVKYGGHAMVDPELSAKFARDMVQLKLSGINPIVVHGGGPQIGSMLERLKIESRFEDGLRVTDKATMEVVEMILAGYINKSIVAGIQKAGGKAIGISGKDGNLCVATKLKRTRTNKDTGQEEDVDLGFVGDPGKINPDVLETIIHSEAIPVIAPIGVGLDGETYNINADTFAGAIAVAMKAKRLLLLTDVAGVLDNNKTLLPELTLGDIDRLTAEGVITGGMIPKLESCASVVRGGVDGVVITDGRVPHCVLLELLTPHGVGTRISERQAKRS
ncbi:MAG: acetylglutamate kinase [Anderseniella sp.]|jgi:acetylglutamate kinase|nr:acetylglutamate kinase [Anderseniella sp.]